MKYLPIDVSTFSTMINGNYLYVDKTKEIHDLFAGGNRYYFLSRPRRFGKSLLISTLKEYFEGNKALFERLWVSTADYHWTRYPVIHLDFSLIPHKTPEEFSISLSWTIDFIAQQHNIETKDAPFASLKLRLLLENLVKQYGPNSVVILVDEYDKPMLDHINNIPLATQQREVLKTFYDTLKGLDGYLRAIFITGVTKFSKTSIFSGINNLNDITLDRTAASLLGYTEQEISANFGPYIEIIGREQNRSVASIKEDIQIWYNGYRFSEADTKVYNPFSLLYFFSKKKLANYWFQSGTPTFLINLLKKDYISLEQIEDAKLTADSLGTFELENIPLLPLLFQAGYLTIKTYDKKDNSFILGYPNKEVEESFKKYLISSLANTNPAVVDINLSNVGVALENYDMELLCNALTNIFSHIPYNLRINRESYYHSLLQLILTVVGKDANSEVLTDKGRIDLVVKTKRYIYIFELKIDEDPKAAIIQIKQKRYYQRFLNQKRQVILVGLGFMEEDGMIQLYCSSESID